MSQHQVNSCDLSKFDALSTEKLEEILYLDSLSDKNKEYDTDTILYIAKIVSQRNQAKPSDHALDAGAAWEDFKKKYMPAAGLTFDDKEAETAHKKHKKLISRIGVAAAVFCALMLGTGYGAYANNINLWDMFANWSKDSFSMNPSADIPSEVKLLLNENGLFDDYVPTWFPEGYEYQAVETTGRLEKIAFFLTYTDGTSNIIESIIGSNGTQSTSYEKDENLVEIYTQNNMDHYIIENFGQLQIIWINGDCECCLSGPFSTAEAKKMIDSIYRG